VISHANNTRRAGGIDLKRVRAVVAGEKQVRVCTACIRLAAYESRLSLQPEFDHCEAAFRGHPMKHSKE